MIAALRRKLALLLTGVLSAVVLCTALAALIVSERQMEESEWVRLMAQVERVAQDVRIGNVLQASELGKMEAAGRARHLHCGWRRAHPLPRGLADADGEGNSDLARTGGCGGRRRRLAGHGHGRARRALPCGSLLSQRLPERAHRRRPAGYARSGRPAARPASALRGHCAGGAGGHRPVLLVLYGAGGAAHPGSPRNPEPLRFRRLA